MNPDGDIRKLEEGEEPQADEVMLLKKEAERLQKLPKEKRHDALKVMRAQTKRERRQKQNLQNAAKQPRSCMPKSMR